MTSELPLLPVRAPNLTMQYTQIQVNHDYVGLWTGHDFHPQFPSLATCSKELKECSGHVFVDSVPEFCLPETELIDMSTVDVILISNYHCMMALPYITEHTGFTGTVYATEPTLQIGRLLMEELVNFIERVPKAQSASLWKNKDVQRLLPSPLKDAVEVSTWRRCYSMQEVNSALSKIQLVGYSQKIELFGAVQVTPLSSGYALGSSNWVIQSHYEKVSYVSGSSLLTTHPQVLYATDLLTLKTKVHLTQAMVFSIASYAYGSWTMNKEDQRRIDTFKLCWRRILNTPWTAKRMNKSVLEEVQPECSSEAKMARLRLPYFGHVVRRDQSLEKDIMLGRVRGQRKRGRPSSTWIDTVTATMNSGIRTIPMDQASLKNSDVLLLTGLTQIPTANPDGMVGEFCSNLALTVRNGGNVLVPCYPSGVIYDLLECLYQYIDSAGLSNVPFYFISPVANSSLEFSQIFAEWLCHNKQTKVYLPEPPFPHAELIQTNKLKHYPSIHGDFSNDFRQPCVVFTGHPSLRFGDVVHFLELWGKSSLNTVIFTEPDFSYLDALAPYQPLAMKCIYCPIDTRLNFIQVSKLLKEVQPLHVVCPEQYTQPPPTQSHRMDLMIDCQPPAMSYRRAEVLALPFKRRYEKIEIMPELADSLVPMEIKPGISLATVSAVLHTKDNKHVLQPPPRSTQPTSGKKRKRVSDDIPDCKVLKPLLSGSIPVEQFVQTLEKHGFSDIKVEDTAKGHIVLLQEAETLIQIEEDSTHIICDNDEMLRVRLRDLVLKFLQKF
ncbi:integrator complex subunit 9 isoform X2 [Loxodonta africana]|uniref:integrator complex subunit 9 isoform X2 n=2 Tax=Loxodonta africana TaxID=9785 RepID=UPI0030D61F0E